jgi:sulfonate transport system substrate-binding protein
MRLRLVLTALLALLPATGALGAPSEIRIDWATYNPISLVLRQQHLLEDAFAKDGITIRWVQSAGSNKALEFLNAGSIDFGSTAGAAALIGLVNGNPIKSVYVYSQPEWTALVTRKDTGIKTVADLAGKRIAVTRGTDPHIFLIRALAGAKLGEKDVHLVLLQHADGRLALARGDVDAWAGLDPMMAQAELDDGAQLFYRDASANSWGILNVRAAFATENPDLVRRVLVIYEQAKTWAKAHPEDLAKLLQEATKLPPPVIARQLERTRFPSGKIGPDTRATIESSGLALRDAGVLPAETDVPARVGTLIDTSYFPG